MNRAEKSNVARTGFMRARLRLIALIITLPQTVYIMKSNLTEILRKTRTEKTQRLRRLKLKSEQKSILPIL